MRATHIDAHIALRPTDDGKVEVRGRATLRIASDGARRLMLDAPDYTELKPTPDPRVEWRYDGRRLIGRWSAPPSDPVEIELAWRTTPTRGVTRRGDAVWTAFHTWRWMPAHSDPAARATLSLTVDAPAGWTTIATGDGADRPGPDIVLSAPHPAYTYGFFAGRIDPPLVDGGLEIWGVPPAAAHAALARTRAAVDRWAGRFGPPFERYVQVFVPGRAAQELAGMAFIGRRHAEGLLSAPDEDWLIVHEMAHQMWGNRATCASWGDFWLNEAIVVWWVARDKQLRGQPAAHARELALWRKRAARAARAGDRRIARPGVEHQDAGGSLVYHAGALLVADLVAAVGVEAFEAVMKHAMQAARTTQRSLLTTDGLLAALPLTPKQRAAARCRLADATAVCPGL